VIDTNFTKVQRSFEPPVPNRSKNYTTFKFPTDKNPSKKQERRLKSPNRLQYEEEPTIKE